MEIFTSAGYLNGWLHHDRRWVLFRQRWPTWEIQFAVLPTLEQFDWSEHMIWLHTTAPHVEFRVAHAAAHLACHMRGYSSRFTPREEDQADQCAEFWLAWGFETALPAIEEVA